MQLQKSGSAAVDRRWTGGERTAVRVLRARSSINGPLQVLRLRVSCDKRILNQIKCDLLESLLHPFASHWGEEHTDSAKMLHGLFWGPRCNCGAGETAAKSKSAPRSELAEKRQAAAVQLAHTHREHPLRECGNSNEQGLFCSVVYTNLLFSILRAPFCGEIKTD